MMIYYNSLRQAGALNQTCLHVWVQAHICRANKYEQKSHVSKANGAICEYLLVTRELLKQRSGMALNVRGTLVQRRPERSEEGLL